MNIYDAIMKAADHIEADPSSYNFFEPNAPGAGGRGCMIGWVGHYMGLAGKDVYHEVVPALGVDVAKNTLPNILHVVGFQAGDGCVTADARLAAKVMRRWAKTYQAPVKHIGIPDRIRAIFLETSHV